MIGLLRDIFNIADRYGLKIFKNSFALCGTGYQEKVTRAKAQNVPQITQITRINGRKKAQKAQK